MSACLSIVSRAGRRRKIFWADGSRSCLLLLFPDNSFDRHQTHQHQRSICTLIHRSRIQQHSYRYHQHRNLPGSSRRTIVSWLPEAMQTFSIWGGSGYILQTLHTATGMPFWACFATISVALRTALFPMVLYGAHTASRFAKIVPDVQFQLALFQKDLQTYRQNKATPGQFAFLLKQNLVTLSTTYRLQNVNPLSIFWSPLLQIPVFMYISIDMRKIINGLDPALAQQLVESSIAWVPDLTEPDPWFGLPVLAGLLLYANVEVALGRRNMAGEAASKADMSIILKDVFQSLAVFMPCFTSYLPAGIQIYLMTSFCFTMGQSAALRHDPFRALVGLPSMKAKPPEGTFSKQMVKMKKLELKAKELRGDGPVLGKGVLMHGWETSFAGNYRKSTIQGSNTQSLDSEQAASSAFLVEALAPELDQKYRVQNVSATMEFMARTPYIHGVSAPPWQVEKQQREALRTSAAAPEEDKYLPQHADQVIERANRGERPLPTTFVDPAMPKTTAINVRRLRKSKATKGKRKK